MSEYNVPFTDEDHRILSSCVTLVEGLADYLGCLTKVTSNI